MKQIDGFYKIPENFLYASLKYHSGLEPKIQSKRNLIIENGLNLCIKIKCDSQEKTAKGTLSSTGAVKKYITNLTTLFNFPLEVHKADSALDHNPHAPSKYLESGYGKKSILLPIDGIKHINLLEETLKRLNKKYPSLSLEQDYSNELDYYAFWGKQSAFWEDTETFQKETTYSRKLREAAKILGDNNLDVRQVFPYLKHNKEPLELQKQIIEETNNALTQKNWDKIFFDPALIIGVSNWMKLKANNFENMPLKEYFTFTNLKNFLVFN